jgi:subtilisin family serine protease
MKRFIFALILGALHPCLHAQNPIVVDSTFWVIVENPAALPVEKNGKPVTSDRNLNALFSKYGVHTYGEAFPDAKTPLLKKVYEVACTECDIDAMISELFKNHAAYFSNYKKHEYQNIHLYDPADYMWYLTTQDPNGWLWHLKKIQADLAWNLTLGSPNIKVAVLDTYFDLTHPDLTNKFTVNYDPYDNQVFNCTTANTGSYWHGTTAASFVAAETIEQGQPGNSGQLASVGFKTMMIGYKAWSGNYLQRAFHASSVMKANVITSSAGGWTNCPDGTGIEQAVVKEILDNGTAIVMPAGNGTAGTHNVCTAIDPVNHTAFFPLSPYYDSRIILVTGTNVNDKHQTFDGSGNDITHSHYPMVDVCSPGQGIMGATPTNCNASTWPYFGSFGGTSFATPIVAGTAALILSINPCLEPGDVEYILKNTTDPVVDAASYPGGVGTGRINAYKAVLMASTFGNQSAITSSTTWSGDRYVKGTLTIEPGATLTITGKVRFAENAKIVVKPHAMLIVNGGHLTNAKGCGNVFWQGIEVWGTSAQNQYPASYPTYQGRVELKNNAIVENARNAITLWKPGDYNAIGGVVVSTGATFKNNLRSVEFISYQNTSPSSGVPVANLSRFSNTKFVVDDDIPVGGFYCHITMWEVNGIPFQNCTFENLSTTKTYSTSSNKAIYSINAGFSVTATCNVLTPVGIPCPSNQLNRSTFRGFNFAIHATGSATTNTVNVDQAYFEDNLKNVQIEGLNNFKTNRSKFFIGGNNVSGTPGFLFMREGVVSINATGYMIEENEFNQSPSPLSFTAGVRINNGGTANNRVYKNTFTQMILGQYSEGRNRNPSNAYEGLQFLCNTNVTNGILDINVNKYNSPNTNDGVRSYQGDPSPVKSAGNIFSQTGASTASDFQNLSDWPINYYHTNGTTLPMYRSTNIYAILSATANTCPSSFSSGLVIGLPKSASKDEYNGYEQAYLDLLYNYRQLTDGGNTPALLQKIQSNWTQEAREFRKDLLSYAPYLSQKALMEAAKTNVLPHAMLLEVCLANPEATKGEAFIQFLGSGISDPMPDYMTEIIRNSWGTQTARTLLEGQLAHYSALMASHTDTKLGDLLTDSLSHRNEINALLNRRGTLEDKYQLLDHAIADRDFAQAQNMLQRIPENHVLDEFGKTEHADYATYVDLHQKWQQGNKSIAQLDSTEIEELHRFAQAATGRPSVLAYSILCYFYQICKDYTPNLPDGNLVKPTEKPAISISTGQTFVTVSPNPAEGSTVFGWQLPIQERASLNIVDATGKVIQTQVITTDTGKWTWDVMGVKAGLYFYEIREQQNTLASGKVIVK